MTQLSSSAVRQVFNLQRVFTPLMPRGNRLLHLVARGYFKATALTS